MIEEKIRTKTTTTTKTPTNQPAPTNLFSSLGKGYKKWINSTMKNQIYVYHIISEGLDISLALITSYLTPPSVNR